jgi:phosphohistidine phosphatase
VKNLLLMRHAKSSWSDSELPDHERPLNNRGNRDAPRMGEWLKSQGLVPDQILCSSAVRANQTADAIAKVVECSVEIIEDLYLASVSQWQRVLATHAGPGIVLAIAHNPGIEEFVHGVEGSYERMPTAAIAWFEVTNENGSDKNGADEEVSFSFESLSLQAIWRPKEVL